MSKGTYTMKRAIKVVALIVGIVAVVVWFMAMATIGMAHRDQWYGHMDKPDTSNTLPPCPTEDSVACYWDATKHGNGEGKSFTVDEEGNVTYWSDYQS